MSESNVQSELYARIHDNYERHYYDKWSMRYRDVFFYGPMFDGLDLDGKHIADIASGSGHNSLAVRQNFSDCQFAGFDISTPACAAYTETLQSPSYCIDLTAQGALDQPVSEELRGRFDAAICIGGIHHMVADLDATFANLAALLKPGGVLVMEEPNALFMDGIRRLWYRLDSNFDAGTEHALDHDRIYAEHAHRYFDVERVHYFGGPAFYLVLNSMIMRIPHWLKKLISPPLIVVDRLWRHIPWRRSQAAFVARWVKRDDGEATS